MIPSGFATPAGHCSLCGRSYPASEGCCDCRDTAPLTKADTEAIRDALCTHTEAVEIGSLVDSRLGDYLRRVEADRGTAATLADVCREAPLLLLAVAGHLAAGLPEIAAEALVTDRARRRREPQEPT